MSTAKITGLERYYEYRDRIKGFITEMEKGPQPNPQLEMFKLVFRQDESIIDCVENGKPFISSWYGNVAEVYAGMDLPYFCPVDNMLAHLPFTDDLEGIDSAPLPGDMCGLIQICTYGVEKGLVPVPTAIVAMLEPCDAQSVMHEAWLHNEEWKNIPMFAMDHTYGDTDYDYKFFAGEIRRMIKFLEDTTGKKYSFEKLKEVVDETNRTYAAWDEYNQLRRAVPCPGGSFQGGLIGWTITQHMRCGLSEATNIFKMLTAGAEANIKANKGWLEKENTRILWADLIGTCGPLGEWLEQEHNTVVVQDFQGYTTPYTHIDTSTEDSMLEGLARRNMNEVPMIRQARGNVDIFLDDIIRIVEDYKVDCVFFPGHKGHKDQSASINFVKETCKDLGVPLLAFTMDIFDWRYLPWDKVKHIVDEFFEAHGLGKYKK